MSTTDGRTDPELNDLEERLNAFAARDTDASVASSWNRVARQMAEPPAGWGWSARRGLIGVFVLGVPAAIAAVFAAAALSTAVSHRVTPQPAATQAVLAPLPTAPPSPPVSIERVALWGNHGWGVVAQSGAVVRTMDGGRTWRPTAVTGSSITHFLDDQHGWAAVYTYATNDWTVQRSQDGGKTWTHGKPIDLCCAELALVFADSRHGWAMTIANGVARPVAPWIQVTSDGGMTWQDSAPRTVNTTPFDCSFQNLGARDAQTAWITGGCKGRPLFEVTHDGGRSWQAQSVPPIPGVAPGSDVVLTPPVFVSASTGSMFGSVEVIGTQPQPAAIYTTQNGGQSWLPVAIPAPPKDVRGSLADNGRVRDYWYIGAAPITAYATLYHSVDGGSTWIAVNHTDLAGVIAIDATDGMHIRVMRDARGLDKLTPPSITVLFSQDGGKTFQDLNPALARG